MPISNNLKAWLELRAKPHGKVLPYELTYAMKLLNKEGMPRKKNAWRHSYISYRLGVVQNVPRVTLKAGNSPTIIFQHYREVVTPQQAQQWFGILPS